MMDKAGTPGEGARDLGFGHFTPGVGRPFGTWGRLTAKPSVETLSSDLLTP